jgi:hypothetical protein
MLCSTESIQVGQFMGNISFSRRAFLRQAAVAGSLTFAAAFGLRPGRAAKDDTQTTLNIAITAEAFACTHYYRAVQTPIFDEIQLDYLKTGLAAEVQHYQFLLANGAKPLTTQFYFPRGTFDDPRTFGAVTATAETVFVSAYLAASAQFARQGDVNLSGVAAQVAVVEGQHLALMRIFDRELTATTNFSVPIFEQVTDAVPMLMPLIDGSTGALGTMEPDPVPFPDLTQIGMTYHLIS